jgi:hypothetical protein
MDMAEHLDEITYHLVADAPSRAEALRRVAIVGHWADQQATRLWAGRALRLDHDQVVAEAMATPRLAGPPPER